MQVSVEHNIGDFVRLWDRVTRDQLPFATALALTKTAQSVQRELRRDLDSLFMIRRNWVSRGIIVENASKRDTLARMGASVGSRDDFMARQELGGEKRAQGRNVAIPLAVRSSPKQVTGPALWPKALLQKSGKRKFFIRKLASGRAKGQMAVLRRVGSDAYPLQVMYLLRPKVEVDPRWNLRATAVRLAPRILPWEMQKAMERALRTAR